MADIVYNRTVKLTHQMTDYLRENYPHLTVSCIGVGGEKTMHLMHANSWKDPYHILMTAKVEGCEKGKITVSRITYDEKEMEKRGYNASAIAVIKHYIDEFTILDPDAREDLSLITEDKKSSKKKSSYDAAADDAAAE